MEKNATGDADGTLRISFGAQGIKDVKLSDIDLDQLEHAKVDAQAHVPARKREDRSGEAGTIDDGGRVVDSEATHPGSASGRAEIAASGAIVEEALAE